MVEIDTTVNTAKPGVTADARVAAARETPCCACECCAGGGESATGDGQVQDQGQRVRVTLPLFGLGCGTEAPIVERALVKVPGVVHAVNPATEMAYVDYHSCACNAEALRDAVAAVGLRAGVPGFR
jgi:hypothetical protein